MKKSLRKLMAVLLALSMSVGMLSLTALGAEAVNGTVEVETLPGGGKEEVDVIISINGDTVQKETAAGGDKTESGANVKYESTETTDADGNVISSQTSYDVQNGTYNAQGGSTITTEKGEGASDITVNVPLTSENGKNQETTETVETDSSNSANSGTGVYNQTTTTTTSSATVTTNQITVTETHKVVDENGNVIDSSDLDYVLGTVTPQGGENENNLIYFQKPGATTPDATTHPNYDPNSTEWGYMFESTGVISQYWPAFVTTNPEAGTGNNTVVYTHTYVDENGNQQTKTYYLYKKFDNTSQLIQNSFDSLYVDGKETPLGDNSVTIEDIYVIKNTGFGAAGPGKTVTIEDVVPTTWTMASQFVLVDMETGEKITTYCADFVTPTQGGFRYNIENLEDADYYSDAEAAMIRTIAANGYWGVEGTEPKVDENGNTVLDADGNPVMVPKDGSLAAMKEMLLASGQFTEAEMALLTDGIALTATQMAIWTYSNKMDGIEFVNAHYTKDQLATKDESKENTIISTVGGAALNLGSNDAVEGSATDVGTDLLFKVYEYLKNMAPTAFEGNQTSANTIINADNFLKDMDVTVIEKDADHANNADNDDTNDAYVTNLTFALVVTPSTENGDDLIVKVLGSDGKTVLASGRIAGELKEGEEYVAYDEATGNYTLSGFTMVEGDVNFNITLEGVQNLKEGVYLYSSEVVDGTSSQTMVGMATGEHAVDVSMNINFELSVEDEVVVTERVWRTEWDNYNPPSGGENPPSGGENPPSGGENPPSGGENPPTVIEVPEEPVPMAPSAEIEEEEVPLVDMIDEEVPLANVPVTGDASALWLMMSLLSGTGLAGVSVLGRKKHEEI